MPAHALARSRAVGAARVGGGGRACTHQHAVLVGERPRNLVPRVAAVADVVQQHDRRRGLVAPLEVVHHDPGRQQHRALLAALARPIVVAEELSIVGHDFQVLAKLQVRFRRELHHALVVEVAVRSGVLDRVLVRLVGGLDLRDARVDLVACVTPRRAIGYIAYRAYWARGWGHGASAHRHRPRGRSSLWEETPRRAGRSACAAWACEAAARRGSPSSTPSKVFRKGAASDGAHATPADTSELATSRPSQGGATSCLLLDRYSGFQ